MAIKTAKEEGYETSGRVTTPGDFYFGKLKEFAMHFCTFYKCYECKEPYFGGMLDCEQAMTGEDKTQAKDLLCKPCFFAL